MKNKAFIYDAFTDKLFLGNQAAIILDAENLNEKDMLNIAKEFSYSETVFVQNSYKADFKFNFFTPSEEVNLCGHATIACIKCLADEKIMEIKNGINNFKIETNIGILNIYVESTYDDIKNIFMEQDKGNFIEVEESLYEEIFDSLGLSLSARDENIKLVKSYTGLWDLMIALKDKKYIDLIVANLNKIRELSKKLDIISFHPFYFDEKNKFCYVRNFAPIVLIDEEPATGTSNAALLYYLYKLNKIKEGEILTCIQGEKLGRISKIICKIEKGKILVGGNACRFLSGNIK